MKGFILLTQFMTRIPIPIKIEYNENRLGKAFKFFPILGLIIGIILSLCYLALIKLIDNRFLIATIIVTIETLITGGLHLDGLADSFDALFSYRPREKMLEIMKDSRVGTNGVLVLILYYAIKIACIMEVSWQAIILMSVLSRLSSVINAGFGKYAREKGMGGPIIEFTNKTGVTVAFICSIIIAYSLGAFEFILITILSAVFAFYFLKSVSKKIDGITGDTLGAVLELSSLVVLIMVVIIK